MDKDNNLNERATSMHLFEEGELLTREELRKRKEDAIVTQQRKTRILMQLCCYFTSLTKSPVIVPCNIMIDCQFSSKVVSHSTISAVHGYMDNITYA